MIPPVRRRVAQPGAATSGIIIVQSAIHGVINGANASATWPAPTTTGNLLVAFVLTQGVNNFSGGGWTAVQQVNSGAFIKHYEILNAASRSGAETITVFSGTDSIMCLLEISGCSATPEDQPAVNHGSGTAISTASVTTTAANEILLAGMGAPVDASAQTSPTNGFSIVAQLQFNSSLNLAVISKVVNAIGTYSGGTTLGSSQSWVSAIESYHT